MGANVEIEAELLLSTICLLEVNQSTNHFFRSRIANK